MEMVFLKQRFSEFDYLYKHLQYLKRNGRTQCLHCLDCEKLFEEQYLKDEV